MTFFKRIVWVGCLAVTACSFKGVQAPVAPTGENSPFVFSDIVVSPQVEILKIDAASGLPTQKAYHLKICAIDRASKQPITGQILTLHRGSQATALEATDSLGCTSWREEVHFKARVKKPLFVSLPRRLSLQGVGTEIPLAANPWLEGPSGLADLRRVKLAIPASAPEDAERILLGAEDERGGPTNTFDTDGSRGKFNGVKEFDPKTSLTTVGFTSQVRIVNPTEQSKRLNGLQFEYLVSDTPQWPEGATGTPARSNSDGDIKVQGLVTYNDLAKTPEHYLTKYILVRSPEDSFTGVTRSVEVQINPWQRNDLFYQDVKNQGHSDYVPPADKEAKLVLPGYTAYYLDRTFELNSHLELTAIHEWNFTLKPGILRANPARDPEPKQLQEGTRFKLTAVLADPFTEATRPVQAFISAFETEVEIDEEGEINTPVFFPVDFTQQPRLDSQARVHFTLTPLSSEAGIVKPVVMSANFVSNPNGNDKSEGEKIAADAARRGTLPIIPLDATRLITKGKGKAYTLKIDWVKPPLALYAEYWEPYGPLTLIAAGDPPAACPQCPTWDSEKNWRETPAVAGLMAFAASESPDVQKAAPGILAPFCQGQDAFSPAMARDCAKNPESFFHLSLFTVVEKVLNASPTVNSTNNYFGQLSVAFFNEHQHTQRQIAADKSSEHWIGGMSGKLGYGVMGPEAAVTSAFNKEREWYRILESASGDSQRSRVSSAETINLSKEEIVLQLALKTRQCALVRSDRFLLATAKAAGKKIQSVLFCAASKTDLNAKESWFSVRDRWNNVHSSLTRPKDPRERGWTKMIRGAKAFSDFEHIIRDNTRAFYFQKVDPFIDGVDSFIAPAFDPSKEARLARDGGIFPGILSLSESTPLQWNDGQIQNYVGKAVTGMNPQAQKDPAHVQFVADAARCFYETAARRWDHEYFKFNANKLRKTLNTEGIGKRCAQFANEGAKP